MKKSIINLWFGLFSFYEPEIEKEGDLYLVKGRFDSEQFDRILVFTETDINKLII